MDNDKEFKELVEIEITNLDMLCREMADFLSGGVDKRSSFEVRAAASILHDFYCGVEKIFERVALTMDKNLPSGLNWHTDLLLRMGDPVEGIRSNVISGKLKENLKEYLRFRHLFRHIYGFELKWERIKPLCLELNGIFDSLKSEIEKFLSRPDDPEIIVDYKHLIRLEKEGIEFYLPGESDKKYKVKDLMGAIREPIEEDEKLQMLRAIKIAQVQRKKEAPIKNREKQEE